MTEEIGKANEYASFFEAFIANHPFVTAILVATLVSWAVTAAFKVPLRALLPDAWQDWCIRTFDCAVAGAVAWYMWPGEHDAVWALLVGTGSPVVYWALSGFLVWKWPGLQKYLTLRELQNGGSEDDTEGGVGS